MFKFLFLVVLMFGSAASAQVLGYKDQGNGGDGFVSHFRAVASVVRYHLFVARDLKIDRAQFAAVTLTAEVESTDTPLTLHGVEKDALNFPAAQKIIFNRKRWSAMSFNQQATLVLHEYLGLLGKADESYAISNGLLYVFNLCEERFKIDDFRETAKYYASMKCETEATGKVQNLQISLPHLTGIKKYKNLNFKTSGPHFITWKCANSPEVHWGSLAVQSKAECRIKYLPALWTPVGTTGH